MASESGEQIPPTDPPRTDWCSDTIVARPPFRAGLRSSLAATPPVLPADFSTTGQTGTNPDKCALTGPQMTDTLSHPRLAVGVNNPTD
jgi:hypothetical protein